MRGGSFQPLIVERLLKNDDHYRWLSLTNNDIGCLPISELTAALLQNRSLRKVSCHAGFLASLTPEDLLELLSALSQLPHLQELWLALPVPSRQTTTTTTAAATNPPAAVCRSSEVLETLLLNNHQDNNTAATESNVKTMDHNDVHNNHSNHNGNDDEEWISTLHKTPNNNNNNNSRLQLHKLTIRGMDDAGCRVLARALQQQQPSSRSMTDLQLRGLTTTTRRMTSTAANNNNNKSVTFRGILEIAQLLQENRSLERVEMAYQGLLDGTCCRALAKALAVNDKLQKLDLTSSSSSRSKRSRRRTGRTQQQQQQQDELLLEEGWKELVETIRQQNDTLCHLNISQAEGDSKILLDLLTKLNRSGARACLRGNGSRRGTKNGVKLDDVVKILSRHNKETNTHVGSSNGSSNPGNTADATDSTSEDISAVYELLSLNPALWDPVKANAKARKTLSSSTTADTGAENMCIDSSSNTKLAQQQQKQISRERLHSTGKRSPLTSLRAESEPPFPKKVKPVMARWNERLISILEREKVEEYKRRTPTIY